MKISISLSPIVAYTHNTNIGPHANFSACNLIADLFKRGQLKHVFQKILFFPGIFYLVDIKGLSEVDLTSKFSQKASS